MPQGLPDIRDQGMRHLLSQYEPERKLQFSPGRGVRDRAGSGMMIHEPEKITKYLAVSENGKPGRYHLKAGSCSTTNLQGIFPAGIVHKPAGRCRMSRGHRPVVAIGQAGRYAEAQGFTVIAGLSPAIPFDLMITRDEQIIMVRVRRLRYRNYESPSIIISCWREISGIRASTIPARISRELWVLGPDRTFHRYRVKPDCIRHIGCWEVCQHDLQETVTG